MPLSQTSVPNIPDTTQLLNDSYTDRSSETHIGIVAEDNRLRDIMASIQANTSTIVSSMEGSISSNSGAINGLLSTVSTLNGKVGENTSDITENANSILDLTQTLESDIANVRSLITQNSSDITANKNSILQINDSLSSLTTLVNDMNTAFYAAMQSSNLRVSGEYTYLDELPSFSGAASQGSFAIVGHSQPQVGDLIYQAGSSKWVKVSDWNLVSIATSLNLVPAPTGITDIVLIGSNGNYIMFQPVMSYGDDGITPTYTYDETVSLGSPSAMVANDTSLPKITLSNGSMITFQYHYRSLVSGASEGEYALVDGTSYIYKNSTWLQQSPSHKFFVIAWNGAWVPLSAGSGVGGASGLTITKTSSNSKPSTSGKSVMDMTYYQDSSNIMCSMWVWDGASWITVPLTPYADQMLSRSGTNLQPGVSAYLVNQMKTNLVNMLYPVGTIYMSMASTNPSSLFGGTWVQTATGRTLVGVDSSDYDFNASKKSGGEKTHILTVNEMPSHSHSMPSGLAFVGSGSNGSGLINGGSDQRIQPTGGGAAHNNMQPYITTYIWQRTA